MPIASPSLYRSIVALLVIGSLVVVSTALAANRASATESTAPSVICETADVVYGAGVQCTGEGGSSLQWPDGTETGLTASQSSRFVGDGQVRLLDDEGATQADAPLRITPDIAIDCQDRDNEPKLVFELETTELRSQGWDYVYLDSTSGEKVRPGDPTHPSGGSEDGLERIVLDEVRSTGLCRIVSHAADDLEADFSIVIESPWESAQTTTLRIIGPSSKTQWAGTQPAVLTGTVTINNVTASERVNVYQSGCS